MAAREMSGLSLADALLLCELLANTDSSLDRGLVRKMRLAFSLAYGFGSRASCETLRSPVSHTVVNFKTSKDCVALDWEEAQEFKYRASLHVAGI
jgi:hypothetical protein